jgi:CRP/FNR family transcriptional regulator, anaerobic regulatory protein
MVQQHDIRGYLDVLFPEFEETLKEYIVNTGSLSVHKAGKALPSMNHETRTMLLIVQGNMKIYRIKNDDKDFYGYMIGAGEGCALSMTCAVPNIRAVPVSELKVINIPMNHMRSMMLSYPTWNEFVLKTLCQRIEAMLSISEIIASKKMDERLELYIKDTMLKLGERSLHITHQEIADDLNTSREVITRLLKKMETDGRIRSTRYSVEWTGMIETGKKNRISGTR